MNNIDNIINKVSNNLTIELNDIPDIDLYMDQVIQLFDNKLSKFQRTEDEKMLTKTMINNYVKGKLLMPVNKKKYSKEHILLISLIYELKGILSINDIQSLLSPLVTDIAESSEEFDLNNMYKKITKIRKEEDEEFKIELNNKLQKINNEGIENDYEKKIILISDLAIKANMYRRLSEAFIDELISEKCKK